MTETTTTPTQVNLLTTRTMFYVGDEAFFDEAQAREYLATLDIRASAAAFAEEHHATDGTVQPSRRAITRTVNVIVEWEAWNRARADTA